MVLVNCCSCCQTHRHLIGMGASRGRALILAEASVIIGYVGKVFLFLHKSITQSASGDDTLLRSQLEDILSNSKITFTRLFTDLLQVLIDWPDKTVSSIGFTSKY
ncbi:hypothetical protein QE152_g34445 [Popillia japonica]|uniref:Uncharacterized protein n=1 Tax=Popillia japonica TaxID=7064 RepID=A0AAW1IT06_POPJA